MRKGNHADLDPLYDWEAQQMREGRMANLLAAPQKRDAVLAALDAFEKLRTLSSPNAVPDLFTAVSIHGRNGRAGNSDA